MGYERKTLTWSGEPADASAVVFEAPSMPAGDYRPVPADAVLIIHSDGTSELRAG